MFDYINMVESNGLVILFSLGVQVNFCLSWWKLSCINRCSGVMGKYATGELKPPTIGTFSKELLLLTLPNNFCSLRAILTPLHVSIWVFTSSFLWFSLSIMAARFQFAVVSSSFLSHFVSLPLSLTHSLST